MTIDPLDIIDAHNKRIAKVKNRLFISINEAAEKNKVSRTVVWKLIRENKIRETYRVGKTWIIPNTWIYRKKKRGRKNKEGKNESKK